MPHTLRSAFSPDGAAVDHHRGGVGEGVGGRMPRALEFALDSFAVGAIHLASDRPDEHSVSGKQCWRHVANATLGAGVGPKCHAGIIALRGTRTGFAAWTVTFCAPRFATLRRPAVVAFLVLATVLIALVFLVSAGRALGVLQYLGLVAVAVVTAAFAVGLMYAGQGSGDTEA